MARATLEEEQARLFAEAEAIARHIAEEEEEAERQIQEAHTRRLQAAQDALVPLLTCLLAFISLFPFLL